MVLGIKTVIFGTNPVVLGGKHSGILEGVKCCHRCCSSCWIRMVWVHLKTRILGVEAGK